MAKKIEPTTKAKAKPAPKGKPKQAASAVDLDERIEIKITTRSAVSRDQKVTVYEPGTRMALTRAELAAMNLVEGSFELLDA